MSNFNSKLRINSQLYYIQFELVESSNYPTSRMIIHFYSVSTNYEYRVDISGSLKRIQYEFKKPGEIDYTLIGYVKLLTT